MRIRDGKQWNLSSANKKEIEEVLMRSNPNLKKDENNVEQSNLQGDYGNVLLLLLLYVLQGIPLGMAGSIPMILQNKHVNYKQQAMFSFVYWPFSLKLLWAPIVDAAFMENLGRRKTWLVPVQYLIAAFMLLLSVKVDDLLNGDVPNVPLLTVVFFSLNFLAATQDIAVDGWALTMLQRRNVGYASTCNSVGQTAGYFVGNVILLAFSSPDFCNKYIRSIHQDTGLITLSGFLFFWGIIFLITTTLVWIFKKENDCDDLEDHGILGTYHLLIEILRLPSIKQLVVMLLTVRVGFAAADSVTGLKLIEAGVKKESLALMAVPLVPLQIILPLVISKLTAGPRPLDVYAKAIPFRLFMGFIFTLLVYWTQILREQLNGDFPYYYFVLILVLYGFHQVTVYCMFVSIMGFFAKISDPKIGGTYMTLLNTISNLGGNWPSTVVLWFIDPLTITQCTGAAVVKSKSCGTQELVEVCTSKGGTCSTIIDGYYVESAVCIVLGFIWLLWRKSSLTVMQNLKITSWRITPK